MSILYRIRHKVYKIFHPVLGEIWMLHRVIPENQRSNNANRELEVTPGFLEQKIQEYKAKGYGFVSIDEVERSLTSCWKSFFARKFVCITLDDGYRDNFDYALPVFHQQQVPFAIYVTTGFIDNKQEMWWYPGQYLGMSKEQLIQLDQDPLCTIGAHTLSHPKLDELSFENQRKEIVESKLQLESWLGHAVNHFSYPHGAYNADTIEVVKGAKFSTALMAWGGVVRKGVHPNILPRIIIKS